MHGFSRYTLRGKHQVQLDLDAHGGANGHRRRARRCGASLNDQQALIPAGKMRRVESPSVCRASVAALGAQCGAVGPRLL